ncbi:hypothetical protein LTR66_001829 [Elasticomyces elasticus]|nr:hypothetical protein LTR66_001829 [Elasticomyces elasticus]
MNGKDLEKGSQPLVAVKAKESITSSAKLTFCVAVNVLATVGIVCHPADVFWGFFDLAASSRILRSYGLSQECFVDVYVNKSIFENKSFKRCPSSFVAFHFITTGIMLYIASRPQMGIFTPARTSVTSVLPLAMIMCANVVLVNLSLAHSSIVLYQIVRVLLTPLTAVLNFCFYGSRISLLAALSILPACAGVGLVSYYDSLPATAGAVVKETSATGVIFAFSGLATSAVYTLWVSQYHRKLTMTSTQLLFNQMPIGVLILAVVSLFTDTFPVWSEVLPRQWLLLFLVH